MARREAGKRCQSVDTRHVTAAETATYRKRWCREASEAGRWSRDDYDYDGDEDEDEDGDDDGGAWDFRGWSVVIDSGPVRELSAD